jgi:hypothetical protein
MNEREALLMDVMPEGAHEFEPVPVPGSIQWFDRYLEECPVPSELLHRMKNCANTIGEPSGDVVNVDISQQFGVSFMTWPEMPRYTPPPPRRRWWHTLMFWTWRRTA